LVINWLACLLAGLRPLILQYPNKKQNREYWADSIRHTVTLVGLQTIIADSSQAVLQLDAFVQTIHQSDIDAAPAVVTEGWDFSDFEILQLSSGTTGYRKGIAFRRDDLVQHATDFNRALRLTPADVIVSWLPLYHDMGFIACFVLPLLLGIDVVMMDPVTWVQQPDLLFKTIARQAGTVCYMPNFGFEVMSRQARVELPTMRWWISCSEPVSARTARKFMDHIGAPHRHFAACYAMAENIFAVSLSRGIATADVDGTEVVSCGRPIAGVDVKIVDGQVWVRSPVSLERYIGGDDIRDSQGFYPTGDLGAMIHGELHIAGRMNDLMIQAGRKFLLSDIDLRINEILPEVRGRAAALALKDDRLETEIACVLIEADDFFRRTDQREIEIRLKAVTGVDQVAVHFVPPRFLTKTTSGKINRKKTLADWQAVQQRQSSTAADPVRDLDALFGALPGDEPVGTLLDSLSLTLLQMIVAEGGVPYAGDDSLDTIRGRLVSAAEAFATEPSVAAVRIVAIGERMLFDRLTEADLDKLSAIVGSPVTFEHVCLPPAGIVLSDLIFCDYFAPRLDPADFVAVERALTKLRNASVLLVDDTSEMFYPNELVYAALSHSMERDPRTDLLSVRWQNYAQLHDRLPLTIVRGSDLALADSSASIAALSDYLTVPVFRIANYQGFGQHTAEWEWRPLRGHSQPFRPDHFIAAFEAWLAGRTARIKTHPKRNATRLDLTDAIHFCSHAIKQEPIDLLLEHFERFCIAGRPSSVPYIRKRLAELGKPLMYIPSYAPEVVAAAGDAFDCILICGAMGQFPIAYPAVALQHVGQSWRTLNLEKFGDKFAHLNVHGSMEAVPGSGEDWFHYGDLIWGRDHETWKAVRLAAQRGEPG
jgi:acyl-CoA synthetase (AMP-forming)/AMP-acid ligase II